MTTTATDLTDTPTTSTPDTDAGSGSGVRRRRRVRREVVLVAAPVVVAGLLLARMALGVAGMAVAAGGSALAALVWWRIRHRRAAADRNHVRGKGKGGKGKRERHGEYRRGGRVAGLLGRFLPARVADRMFGRTASYRPAGGGGGLAGRRAAGPAGRGGLLGRIRPATGGGTGGGLLGRKKAARAATAGTGRGAGGSGGRGGLLGRKKTAPAGGRLGSSGGRAGGGRSGTGGPRLGGRAGGSGGGGRSGGRSSSTGRGRAGGRSGGRGGGTRGGRGGSGGRNKRGRRFAGLFAGRRDRDRDGWMHPDGAKYVARFLPGRNSTATDTPPDPPPGQPPAPRYRDPDTVEFTPVSDPAAPTPAPTPKGDDMTSPDYMGAVKPVEHATDARRVIAQMPDRLGEQVAALERQHDEIVNNVALSPDVVEAMQQFTRTSRVHAQGYDAVNSALLTKHAEGFRKIDEGSRREAAWNVRPGGAA